VLEEEARAVQPPVVPEVVELVPFPPEHPVPPPHVDGHEFVDEILVSGVWGCFGLSAIPMGRKNGGPFQARCPWHKRKKTVGCDKHVRITGPLWQDRYVR
jgi:hypothetical protein